MLPATHTGIALFFHYHLDFNTRQTHNKHLKQARLTAAGV